MRKPLFSLSDARRVAKRRMPRVMFDFVDGAAGDESASELNKARLDEIRLLPRVLVNTEKRNLCKDLLGQQWSLPFGIAPMGMCDLAWPGADRMLARAAVKYNIPIALSTMASSSIEDTRQRAGEHAWFQLYVGQSEEIADDMIRRAQQCGYDTLMLTVDVPLPASRLRDQRNGFQAPMKIGVKQFFDFASHPHWSIQTLIQGVPEVANNSGGKVDRKFLRGESRGKVDWNFLDRLRQNWKGKLIVKGVLSPQDAVRIRDSEVDAIYVSNHGGRQLDSAPASIQMLPGIRDAVGEAYPLIFDGGVRSGESVIKALALGADFVMMGRPFLYAIGAGGQKGLFEVIDFISQQIDSALAQLGKPDINLIDSSVIVAGG